MMKPGQIAGQAVIPIKKQQEGQLKQLLEHYFLEVGTEMWPIVQSAFDLRHTSKESTSLNDEKVQQRKRKIQSGKMILLSTAAVLLCTMIGILEYYVVLVFGLFWGFAFTKYEVKHGHQLTEILLYWMILALLTTLENILRLTLFFVPFYHSLKLFFIISLLYPKINLKTKINKETFLPRVTILSQDLLLKNN